MNDETDLNRSSFSSITTPSECEDGVDGVDGIEDDNDEPLPSGTGVVSKVCSLDELEGWSDVLVKWQSNVSYRPKHVHALVRRGIPEALRAEVWQLLAGCHDDITLMEQYRLLINRQSPFEKNIKRDINRTFPAHEFFKESGSLGQESLFKLCKAYSNYDPEIGYCQGLSFMMAVLLLHMPEEQAFCVLVKIMNNYGLRTLFRCGFEELHCKFYQLERSIEHLFPELHSHFVDLGIEAHMYASQWFLTLFTAKFPLNVVFPILDLFLLDGINTIFQVALALLVISKKDLLALDFEGVLKYFRVALPKKFRNEDNGKLLLKTAISIKIKKLGKYEKEYKTWKESLKMEDPIERIIKENKKLLDSTMRLDQENDNLAQELLITCDSKIKLRADLDVVEDKADFLNTELLETKCILVEVEGEKTRLEDEVKFLKEICRRELERAETEIARNVKIIDDYKKICSQLQSRFDSEQNCWRESLQTITMKVRECERCAQLFTNTNNNHKTGETNGDDSDKSDNSAGNSLSRKIEELEDELIKTKVSLVEAEYRNEELVLQLNSAHTELNAVKTHNDESKNKWLLKTLSSIREAAKLKLDHQPHQSHQSHHSHMSRENSRDFNN